MVFLVVSQTTQQLGHSTRCCSRFARSSPAVFSSRKSVSSDRNCLHVSKGVISFAFEETREPVAQLQPGAQQAALHRGYAELEYVGSLFGRQSVHVAKSKHRTVNRREFVDGLGENRIQFLLRVSLLGVGIPGGDLTHNHVLAGVNLFVERYGAVAL